MSRRPLHGIVACLALTSCVLREPSPTREPSGTTPTNSTLDSNPPNTGTPDTGTPHTGDSPVDSDGDGYTKDGGDCDDTDPSIHPGAEDDCGDQVDEDCDGAPSDCGPLTLDLSDADAKLIGEELVAVAEAGDVDGDGNVDLLFGASPDDEGGYDAGAAYVVLGPTPSSLDLTRADAKLLGEEASDYAGLAVGGADMDGDGLDDVLVGAPWNDEGASAGGALYVVLGPVTGTVDLAMADAKLVGKEFRDRAGISFDTGDVNGDGNADLLVGSARDRRTGAAYVVLGPVDGSAALSGADATVMGEASNDEASIVSCAGDVDADGRDDLLVGAWQNDHTALVAGAAYVVLGPITGTFDLASADAKLRGVSRGDMAGWDVAGAGDVDADGHDDVLIGAPHNDAGAIGGGAAYLVLGPASGDRSLSLADAKLLGEAPGDEAGRVAGAGDVDGDGHADLLVGAVSNDEAGETAGAAYVLKGPVSGTIDLSLADVKLVGEDPYDAAGWDVSSAGDVDGDGRDDVLVDAIGNAEGGYLASAAYLVYGSRF